MQCAVSQNFYLSQPGPFRNSQDPRSLKFARFVFLLAPHHLAVVSGPQRYENNNWKSSGTVINALLDLINNDC